MFSTCLDQQLSLFQDLLTSFNRNDGSSHAIRENLLLSLNTLQIFAHMGNPLGLFNSPRVYYNPVDFNQLNFLPFIEMLSKLKNILNFWDANLI